MADKLVRVEGQFEDGANLEDLLVELGILPSEKEIREKEKFVQRLGRRFWANLFLSSSAAAAWFWVSALLGGIIGTKVVIVFSVFSFILFVGSILTLVVGSLTFFFERTNEKKLLSGLIDKRAITVNPVLIRDEVVKSFRGTIQKYRDKLLGDASEFVLALNDLQRKLALALSLEARYEMQLRRLEIDGPAGTSSQPYIQMKDEYCETVQIKENLLDVIEAFENRRNKLLDFFAAQDARIDQIKLRLDRPALSCELASLRGGVREAIDNADEAVICLVQSFCEDSIRISRIVERVALTPASVEGRAQLEAERALGPLPSIEGLRKNIETVQRFIVGTADIIPDQ